MGELPNNPYSRIAQAGTAVAGGAMGIAQDIGGVYQTEKNINTDITQQAYNGIDRPTYGLGDEIQELGALKNTRDDVGKGLIGRSVGQGAMAGLSVGAATMNPWGMAIGTVVGAIGGLFAGSAGKKKALAERDRKISEFGSKIAGAQESFSESNEEFGDLQQGRSIFNRLQARKENRMYNIPSFNSMY